MFFRVLFVFCCLFSLASCATNDYLYNDENGVAIYQAKCGRWHNLTIGDCLKLAGKQCPKGFNLIDKVEKLSGVGTALTTDINTTQHIHSNTDVHSIGYSIYANSQGYKTAQTSLDSWGGSSMYYDRYIIYSCK